MTTKNITFRLTAILLLVTILGNFIVAQDKKPKVALVLAGGGAKGFAHIPTLELLDSLGIVPDMIVGTSIGSIMGGLYAAGYSGKDIIELSSQVDWETMLAGIGSMSNVRVEEKSEYRRYGINLQLEDGKVKPIANILNDQNILKLFNQLTFPVHEIRNFDSLPIPFRAVCTDVVDGREVVLDTGSLTFAMRASLSLPGIFEPVPYDNTLLVDGGVYNNFPVDVAQRLGADIVIGSDLGHANVEKKNLNSIPSLLFQVAMLNSFQKHAENQKNCDVLIDNIPYLTYSTGDFTKWKTIYNEGKVAANQQKEKLIEIAQQLRKYKQREVIKPTPLEKLKIAQLDLINIDEDNKPLVLSKLNIQQGKTYSLEDIEKGINLVMGTTLYKNIYYNLKKEDTEEVLEIIGNEKSPFELKSSLHYDIYQGVGINLNYTARNIVGNASRTLASVDLAVTPKFRLQHQQNIGPKLKSWWRTQVYGKFLNQNLYFKGSLADHINDDYIGAYIDFNRNIHPLASYIGGGVSYNFYHLTPGLDPDLNENVLDFENYKYETIEFFLNYQFNDLNAHYYPYSGSKFHVSVSTSLFNRLNYIPLNTPDRDIANRTNHFTKLTSGFFRGIPITRKSSIHLDFNVAFTFFDDDREEERASYNRLGIGSRYRLGGNRPSTRRDTYVLPGIKLNEIYTNQILQLHLGYQHEFPSSLYIIPHLDFAAIGYGDFSDFIENAWNPDQSWDDLSGTGGLFSTGCTVSYNSLLGPIDFDISWVNGINEVRFYFGVGYEFN